MFCSNCGTKINGVKFCPECGTQKFSHENESSCTGQVIKEEKKNSDNQVSNKCLVENKKEASECNIENLSFKDAMIQSYTNFLKSAFSFSGRTTRKEYWLTMLASALIAISVYLVEMLSLGVGLFIVFAILSVGMFIYGLYLIPAGISIMARRCNDAGVSKWWLLSAFLSIIPIIGAIAFLIIWISIACKPSKVQA